MDDKSESEVINNGRCSHDWMMEPPWRLVSQGCCQKCKQVKTFLNNPDAEKSPKRSRSRRAIRRGQSGDSGHVTGKANKAS